MDGIYIRASNAIVFEYPCVASTILCVWQGGAPMWISRSTQSQAVSYLIAAIVRSLRKGTAPRGLSVPPRPTRMLLDVTSPIASRPAPLCHPTAAKSRMKARPRPMRTKLFELTLVRRIRADCCSSPTDVPIRNEGATRSRSETWKIGGYMRKNTERVGRRRALWDGSYEPRHQRLAQSWLCGAAKKEGCRG